MAQGCETVFAFGQRGGYLFESVSKRVRRDLPASLGEILDDMGKSTYCAVLGACESFFISYKDRDGSQYLRCQGIPEELKAFLYEKDSTGNPIRDFANMRVALGPCNESWYATDGQSYRWFGLPAGLNEALKERVKDDGSWTFAPRLVALGAHENFIAITAGGGCSRYLANYRTLDGLLDLLQEKHGNEAFHSVQNIFLNAYRLNSFVIQSTNGTMVFAGFHPPAEASLAVMEKVVEKDTKKAKLLGELSKLSASAQAILRKPATDISIGNLHELEQIKQEMSRIELEVKMADLMD